MNTGPTVRDIEVVSNAKIAKKRSELFKRIKCSTVYNYISVNFNIIIGKYWIRNYLQVSRLIIIRIRLITIIW